MVAWPAAGAPEPDADLTLHLDRDIPGDSTIHRADPRLKVALALGAIAGIAVVPEGAFVALLIVLISLIVASASAGLGPWRLIRYSFVAAPFLLALVPVIFLRPGPAAASIVIGPLELTVTTTGLRAFASIAAKSWLSVQVALLLAYTTPFHELVDALRRLRLPEVMVAIISFMYRYLGVLSDEAGRLMLARASRSASRAGIRSGGSLGWRARVTGGMVGSLFIRTYDRSERLYAAMQARGFAGTFRHFHGRRISGSEWLAAFSLATAIVIFAMAAQFWLPRV